MYYEKKPIKRKKNTTMSEKYQNLTKNVRNRVKIETPIPNTHTHDLILSYPGRGTLIKRGEVNLVLCSQSYLFSEMMRSCMCHTHVTKIYIHCLALFLEC